MSWTHRLYLYANGSYTCTANDSALRRWRYRSVYEIWSRITRIACLYRGREQGLTRQHRNMLQRQDRNVCVERNIGGEIFMTLQ